MADETRMSPFKTIKRTTDDGSEYWSARELGQVLGYPRRHRFRRLTAFDSHRFGG